MPVTDVRPVAGSTALPPGYPHPHASQEARAIAEAGVILRAQVGSGVHGTAVAGQDDRDELGICLEPPQFITGLARVPNGTAGLGPSVRFEQYERHTAFVARRACSAHGVSHLTRTPDIRIRLVG
jgi:hypothetical protein